MTSAGTPDPGPAGDLNLFRTYGPTVRRWALRFVRASCDADDIVQEVFLVAHRKAALIRSLENPLGWLLRVTCNVGRHCSRRHARQRRREVAWGHAAPPILANTLLRELEARDVARRVAEVVATLDPRSAELFRLAELERMPTAAISELMGLSPVNVRVQRFLLRGVIARRLGIAEGKPRRARRLR